MSEENDFRSSIKVDQEKIKNQVNDLVNSYLESNSFKSREFLCNLTAAIFLTYRKLYPELGIYIPFRTKSDLSFIKNVKKEFTKYIAISEKDEWDTFESEKDISAIKIILDHIIDDVRAHTAESLELFNKEEIKKLRKSIKDNKNFNDEVDEFLTSPIQSYIKVLELKVELLKRIIDITPVEFKKENMPDPSFKERYEDAKKAYEFYKENPERTPVSVSASEKNEIVELQDVFRARIYDKYEFAILRETLPVVFNDPLIRNELRTSYKYNKESRKPNGFQALYYVLETPFGHVELQAQSNKAHYTATLNHSQIAGKGLNINNFFELIDNDDEYPLSYYLEYLDSVSIDSLMSPYELPDFKDENEEKEFYKTQKGQKYLESERYREMMKHIRIKDKIELLPPILPSSIYIHDTKKTKQAIKDKEEASEELKQIKLNDEIDEEKLKQIVEKKENAESIIQGNFDNCKIDEEKLKKAIENGEIRLTTVNTNDYLLSTALSFSPYMNVCSAGHTSFTNANIHNKKIIGEFIEVLRKRDSNTCLRELLIKRVGNLIDDVMKLADNEEAQKELSPQMKNSLDIIKRHDKYSIDLPRNITLNDILEYTKELQKKDETREK